ncbi:MAG: helix-turn-helix transcriptional regulator, partial [Planctomycetes bacterium]|nr:helix-turn-helix transcriptional regulator [Planctomycetota bacterium]
MIYRSPDHGPDEGICIYLDGLSGHLHGNAQTREQDQRIRSWLRNHGWEVIEISVVELDDPDAMTRHFRKLAGYLGATSLRSVLDKDRTWFARASAEQHATARPSLKIVRPAGADRYRTCVPLVPLKAAAGGFGDPQFVEEGQWDWVEVDSRRPLRAGMFVAQVVGKSMEPRIPDGSYCLFQTPVTGSA